MSNDKYIDVFYKIFDKEINKLNIEELFIAYYRMFYEVSINVFSFRFRNNIL